MTLRKREIRLPRPEGEALRHARHQFDFLEQSCLAFDKGKEAEGARIATNLRILLHQTGRSQALLEQCGVLRDLWLYDSAGQYAEEEAYSALAFVGVQYDISPGKRINSVRYVPNLGGAVRQQPSTGFQIRELLNGRKARRGAGFHLPLQKWWKQPVIRDTAGWEFSREKLVLFLANTDGGAHVDSALPEDYYALSRLNSVEVHAGMGQAQVARSGHETLGEGYTHQMALSVGAAPTSEYILEHGVAFTELGSLVPASVRQIAWELTRSVRQQYPTLMDNAEVDPEAGNS